MNIKRMIETGDDSPTFPDYKEFLKILEKFSIPKISYGKFLYISGRVDERSRLSREKIELEQRKDCVRKKLNDLSVRLEEARRIDAPCCCYDCDSEIQPGHFACEEPSLKMLEMEKSGDVSRSYHDGKWSWYYEPS